MPRTPRLLLLLFVLTPLGGFIPIGVEATVVLSNIQVIGEKAADEYVELYNDGDENIELKNSSLRRKSQGDASVKGSSLKTFGPHDVIPARGYFLWASSSGVFKDLADATTGGGLADNTSLGFFDADGVMLDALTWGNGHTAPFSAAAFENPNKSERFVRDRATLAWSKTTGHPPTNANGETWTEPTIDPPSTPDFKSIVINEVLPNPKAQGDVGEFIELYNPLEESVDLSDWELHDSTKTGKYIFPVGTTLPSHQYIVVYDTDFHFALNNTKETLSLFDAAKRLVHQVSYEKTKDGVTLNLVGSNLRGGKRPTPGEANAFNSDPITKERVPKKGYRNFGIDFRASAKDVDGDKVKYTWDFGDGHKSFKAKTNHRYQKSGRYTVTLTTDDGIDTATETFLVHIKKYQPPKLRITAFMPNPKGKDSDHEWIEIENREKRAVELQGFSIATGAKKKSLVNHPIRTAITLKAKSTLRLTRTDALFSLHNQRGHIELRAPDGAVLQTLSYRFPKSLADDIRVIKPKGQALALETTPSQGVPPKKLATSPVVSAAHPKTDPLSEPKSEPEPQTEIEANPLATPMPQTSPAQNWREQINAFLNQWW